MTVDDTNPFASSTGAPWKRRPARSQDNSNCSNRGDDDDDDYNGGHSGSNNPPMSSFWRPTGTNVTGAAIPHFTGLALKAFLCISVALYVLNQKHALPRPLSAVVSKALFWPTLPITVSRRIGEWVTRIDDTVVMGGAPFGFLNFPQLLYEQYGVRGVINLCDEYQGPVKRYKDLGIDYLYLPTTDHFEPSSEDMISAVSFIRRHQGQGKSVYVHCRAGHGRSAAVVFAWLLYKDPSVDPKVLNKDFCKLRNVRRTLWKQPNIQQLQKRLLNTGTVLLDMQVDPPLPPQTSTEEKEVRQDSSSV